MKKLHFLSIAFYFLFCLYNAGGFVYRVISSSSRSGWTWSSLLVVGLILVPSLLSIYLHYALSKRPFHNIGGQKLFLKVTFLNFIVSFGSAWTILYSSGFVSDNKVLLALAFVVLWLLSIVFGIVLLVTKEEKK